MNTPTKPRPLFIMFITISPGIVVFITRIVTLLHDHVY